ncbi:MAG TPA: 4-hydroxy-tetrahydrodipicolinate reductase [Burkholderiales bacterium]|nr:4-hydroxy-tetrahydrodipicolinate reductase [Burkholderiales bacterium]
MRVAVAGAAGRMGQAIIAAMREAGGGDKALQLGAALEAAGNPSLGKEVWGVKIGSDVGAALAAADLLVDFTRPEATLAHLRACKAQAKSMVIGTTGFSAAQKKEIEEAARAVPVVMAANFAVGVNALFRLAETAARILGEGYDVEIIEAHHRQKVDAPSGTALRLGEVLAKALDRKLAEVERHGRHGEPGARPAREIGFHAVRGGDIVGEHTVLFAGTGERLELTVRSQSRATYAAGALRAARWLQGRKPGLYDMQDVLGLR